MLVTKTMKWVKNRTESKMLCRPSLSDEIAFVIAKYIANDSDIRIVCTDVLIETIGYSKFIYFICSADSYILMGILLHQLKFIFCVSLSLYIR